MSDVARLQQDLHYVRGVVARRENNRAPAGILFVWAVYVLVGYALIDFAPAAAGWFFLIGGICGGLLSAWIGRRHASRQGEHDRACQRQAALHWAGGILLAIFFTGALASAIPALRGPSCSQILVVMIGLVYFLGGVHFDRQFLWLGPVLMIGGVLVGFVPHYGWTALGAIIALGLVVPTFFRRPPTVQASSNV